MPGWLVKKSCSGPFHWTGWCGQRAARPSALPSLLTPEPLRKFWPFPHITVKRSLVNWVPNACVLQKQGQEESSGKGWGHAALIVEGVSPETYVRDTITHAAVAGIGNREGSESQKSHSTLGSVRF